MEPRSEERHRAESVRLGVKQVLRDYAEALVLAVVLALVVRLFVISAYSVPTSSMDPSLKAGDFVFAYKLSYGLRLPFWPGKKVGQKLPERGDVVVFKCSRQAQSQYCVKRVVGLPGDRVQIHKKRLLLNGKYATYSQHELGGAAGNLAKRPAGVLYENIAGSQHLIKITKAGDKDQFGPYVVPPDHVFVLGDNRDSTEDSRDWGAIPVKDVEARVLFVWMSLDWSGHKEGQRLPRVRWNRLFTGPH
ncbi:MAG: signal peptidase I [Bdellovibrionales bacterium]|nr:signal peptidase I [Bdellovibrionales bacterium]